jgi:hypothetical protein
MRRRFVKDYRNPICGKRVTKIVISHERLSWLRQDNFVSLARRRLWGVQAAGRKKTLACKEAFRQAVEKNSEGFRGAPQNQFTPPKAKQLPLIVAAQRSLVVNRRCQNVTVT